jgi:glutamine synthetase
MTPKDVMKMAEEHGVKFVDLQFGDLFGRLHHVTRPISAFGEEFFETGVPFDGSSIRAWKSIDKSDMLLKPDPSSAYIDPFREIPTLCILNDVFEPRTGERYDRDARSIAWKALQYLKSTGIGDEAFFGPEPEFFVFDGIRYASDPQAAYYQIDSAEGPWTTGDEFPNQGHKVGFKEGYFPVSPMDSLMDLRSEMVVNMQTMGLDVELHHHEVATAGQCEINFKFGNVITAADAIHKFKYAVKNTAHKHGKTATFMPKPMFYDNGSGMHCHLSIWKEGKNMFAGNSYGQLSDTAIFAIGGILKHGRAIQVFTNPSANSYRRLVPGYEAPVRLAYSASNRSAAIRIPLASNEKGRRFEFRCPDSSGSPYLVTAAILMAMIDGIKNQIHPGEPIDKNIYDLPPEELANIPNTCKGQEDAIEELYKDMEWLKAGNVFTQELVDAYVNHRKETEIEPLKLRPNPYEFTLYYNL